MTCHEELMAAAADRTYDAVVKEARDYIRRMAMWDNSIGSNEGVLMLFILASANANRILSTETYNEVKRQLAAWQTKFIAPKCHAIAQAATRMGVG